MESNDVDKQYKELTQKLSSYSKIIKEKFCINFSKVFEKEVVQLTKEQLKRLYQKLGIVQEVCGSLSTRRIINYQLDIIQIFWNQKYEEKLEFKYLSSQEYKELQKIFNE